MLSDLLYQLRCLLRRNALEAELEEELRANLEQETAKYERAGLPREEAMRQARIELGGLERVKEECREARGVAVLETALRNLRYCLRPAAAGLALGMAGGVAAAQVIRHLLYDVQPLDASVFVGVALVLLAVAASASLLPAWRASRLDPMVALRNE